MLAILLSLSQMSSGWRGAANWVMLSPDVGRLQIALVAALGLFRLRASLEAENLALRQQIIGLRRTAPKRLPSYSISVSVSESRSAMISGQEPERPSAAMRSSSVVFSTSARKLPEHVTADGLIELVEDRPAPQTS